MPEGDADPLTGIPPPFMYGTHYSTPGYVLFFMVQILFFWGAGEGYFGLGCLSLFVHSRVLILFLNQS